MAGIVQNIITNSLSGFVSGAVTTIGGYAGDAVGGIGNMIERGGQQIGTGISKAFGSYGDSVNAYGTAVRTATAPNAGGYSAVKQPEQKKDKEGEKKKQKQIGDAPKKKALPAPTTGPGSGQKLLMAPPGMKGSTPARPELGSRKSSTDTVKTDNSKALVKAGKNAGSMYTPYGEYKSPADTYTSPAAKKTGALTESAVKKASSEAQGAAKKAGGMGGFAQIPVGGSAGTSTVGEIKPYRPAAKSASKPAGAGVGTGSGGGKYQGPLNLSGIKSSAPSVAGSVKPSAPSKPSGTGAASSGGKYQGPLNLSGIKSGAPSVAGSVKPSKPSGTGAAGSGGKYQGPLNLSGIASSPTPSVAGGGAKPSSGPKNVGTSGGKYQGPLNLSGIISGAPSVAGSTAGGKPGGGYKPLSGGATYKPATNPSNLKAKNVADGGAKTPAPAQGPSARGGGAPRSDGKVRISAESRPKR